MNVVTKAIELGYLNIPKGVLIDIDNIGRYPSNRLVICTTGSQGEPLSALSRMAAGEHRKVSVTANDYIIISATPIPGNEKHVTRVVNDLLKLGAEVIYKSMYEVHVSGHACQGDLKMMLSITKPKFFIPVHGEYKHLISNAQLAKEMGMSPDRILITDIGQVTELDGETMQPGGTVEAGRIFVDGYGVGDVGSIVLRDRQHLGMERLESIHQGSAFLLHLQKDQTGSHDSSHYHGNLKKGSFALSVPLALAGQISYNKRKWGILSIYFIQPFGAGKARAL